MKMKMNRSEGAAASRVSYHGQCFIKVSDADWQPIESIDLGRAAMSLRSSTVAVDRDALVRLRIPTSDAEVELPAVVRHVSKAGKETRYDIEFDQLDEEQSRDVEGIIASVTRVRAASRWTIAALALLAVVVPAVWYLTTSWTEETEVVREVAAPEQVRYEDATTERPKVVFTDITEQSGLDFVRYYSGGKWVPEVHAGGIAFLDYDLDGDQDLFLVNGTPWSWDQAPEELPTHRMYSNDGTGRFIDVTTEVGLADSHMGMGIAVGDYDSDGDPDLYVTTYGVNHLYRNDNGVFAEQPDAGVGGDPGTQSVSSGFFDYDNDGDLDLFVTSYTAWSPDIQRRLNRRVAKTGMPRVPSPTILKGDFCVLYRNDGNDRFTDVSKPAGIRVTDTEGRPVAKALSVNFVDFDDNGFLDIFVANDKVRNFALLNQGDGTFVEKAAELGLAYDNQGDATATMGSDYAYYADTKTLALAAGNFSREATSMWVAIKPRLFGDFSAEEGIGTPTYPYVTFGLFFADYDLDGREDLFQVNGHVHEHIHMSSPEETFRQSPQLFWNTGRESRVYEEIPLEEMGGLGVKLSGRGAAFADIDGDGDLDFAVSQMIGRAHLFRNDQALGHNWIRFQLEGTNSNRDAIGAWIEIEAGGKAQKKPVMPTRSFVSQVERTVTFGLGKADKVDSVRILWPDGTYEDLTGLEVNKTHRIRQSEDAPKLTVEVPVANRS
jgi:hypothetical protein